MADARTHLAARADVAGFPPYPVNIQLFHGDMRGVRTLFLDADAQFQRSALQNAFVWDVTVSGADEAEIGRWLAAHGAAPRPGTVRAHNEKEAWGAVAPTLGAAEVETTSSLVKNLVLGGAGLPEAWFADGDAANRATLSGQMAPTYKMLAARQRTVRAFRNLN